MSGSILKTIGSIFSSMLFLLKECNSSYFEYITHLYPDEGKKVAHGEEMPSEVRNGCYSLKNFAKIFALKTSSFILGSYI